MIKKVFDAMHMVMHLFIGLLLAEIAYQFHPELNFFHFLIPSLIGSFLPDGDHLLYYFTYGRDDSYSKQVRKFFLSGNFFDFIQFTARNHKKLTGLYSHNLLVMMLCFFIGFLLWLLQYWWISIFIVAMGCHLLYDVFEDIILLRRLNKNWYMRYSHN